LLIGGHSRRMGQPKCLLPKGTTTLGAHLWELMARVLEVPPVLVGSGPLDPVMAASPRIDDAKNLRGPLAGILGLHQHSPKKPFLVFAVDLYFMDIAALRWLLKQASTRPGKAIWPKLPHRPFGEPLAAYYPPQAFEQMAKAAKLGETALHRALPITNRLEPEVPAALQKCFTNVNRPEDLPLPSPDP